MLLGDLLTGKVFTTKMDEQIVFIQLAPKQFTNWNLLLASGYLKTEEYYQELSGRFRYTLALTNCEVRFMFEYMIESCFARVHIVVHKNGYD